MVAGNSFALGVNTLQEFTNHLENAVLSKGGSLGATITLTFYPRYYFLSYSLTFPAQKSVAAVQCYMRGDEFFASPVAGRARELTTIAEVEGALDLPLRRAGRVLESCEASPNQRLGEATKYVWQIAPLAPSC